MKHVLFCGEISSSSKAIIESLLTQNIKSLMIANTIEDSIDRLKLVDPRLSHYVGNLTKIKDLEVIYSEAQARTKKRVHMIINHKELSANDSWEDLITVHINSLICSTLMAIKHLGSMNAGGGGTVVNSIAISGRTDDEYASIHRLLNDLDRSFSDPYYFNNTAVRILTMCTRMEIGEGSDSCASNRVAPVAVNVSTETHGAPAVESARPEGADVSTFSSEHHKKIAKKFLNVCANKRSALDPPTQISVSDKHVEEFEISVQK